MRIMFLTKSKKYTCKILMDFIKEHTVVAVVCKKREIIIGTKMEKICSENNIPIMENDEMYNLLNKGEIPTVDLVISNTYGRLIKRELIDFAQGNCINIHGAVLPDYKGVMTYNFGILNGEREWGVTVHFVNEKFDQGDIIEIVRFPINPGTITVTELEDITQRTAYQLTLKVLKRWEKEGKPKGIPQEKVGKYYSRKDFEQAKKIDINSSAREVDQKIRAFYCPPYEGAWRRQGC